MISTLVAATLLFHQPGTGIDPRPTNVYCAKWSGSGFWQVARITVKRNAELKVELLSFPKISTMPLDTQMSGDERWLAFALFGDDRRLFLAGIGQDPIELKPPGEGVVDLGWSGDSLLVRVVTDGWKPKVSHYQVQSRHETIEARLVAFEDAPKWLDLSSTVEAWFLASKVEYPYLQEAGASPSFVFGVRGTGVGAISNDGNYATMASPSADTKRNSDWHVARNGVIVGSFQTSGTSIGVTRITDRGVVLQEIEHLIPVEGAAYQTYKAFKRAGPPDLSIRLPDDYSHPIVVLGASIIDVGDIVHRG